MLDPGRAGQGTLRSVTFRFGTTTVDAPRAPLLLLRLFSLLYPLFLLRNPSYYIHLHLCHYSLISCYFWRSDSSPCLHQNQSLFPPSCCFFALQKPIHPTLNCHLAVFATSCDCCFGWLSVAELARAAGMPSWAVFY